MTSPSRHFLSALHVVAVADDLPTARARKKTPPPFSLRLTAEERARLERMAGSKPLGTYIRDRLLGEDASPRRARRREPVKDQAALAQLLGMLGQMRLSSNLNQIAKGANLGTLPVTPELEEDLAKACAAILAMKTELMRALGYPSERE